MWFLIAIFALLAAAPAFGAQINFGLALRRPAYVIPSAAVPWSQLGIVADSSTDNITALNALGAGVYRMDCPGGGQIRYSGRWLLKSGQSFYSDPNCLVVATGTGPAALGFITQSSLSTPLDGVAFYGLRWQLLSSAQVGRAMSLYANNLTLQSVKIGRNNGALHLRGSCQYIDQLLITDSATTSGSGHVGIRHYGNIPKVDCAQSSDVIVRRSTGEAGDGLWQISLTDQGDWANVSADDYLFEDVSGTSFDGPILLFGQADRVGNVFTASITNVVVRRANGTNTNQCLLILNADNPTGVISNMTIEDSVFDCSPTTSANAAISIIGDDVSAIDGVTLTNITILNPYQRALRIDTGASNISLNNVTLGCPRVGTAYTAQIRSSGSGISVSNSTICARYGGFQVSPPGFTGSGISLTNNIITNIGQTRNGILVQNVDGATITGNVLTPLAGATNALGITLTTKTQTNPGTTNTTVTGNNVSAMTGTKVRCANGQGNVVNTNTGASNCP